MGIQTQKHIPCYMPIICVSPIPELSAGYPLSRVLLILSCESLESRNLHLLSTQSLVHCNQRQDVSYLSMKTKAVNFSESVFYQSV